MLVWLTLPFYDFCGFRSVAVNSVYKLQFFLHLSHITASYYLDLIDMIRAYIHVRIGRGAPSCRNTVKGLDLSSFQSQRTMTSLMTLTLS